jgi:DNA-binding MarR family transcriptional regulator
MKLLLVGCGAIVAAFSGPEHVAPPQPTLNGRRSETPHAPIVIDHYNQAVNLPPMKKPPTSRTARSGPLARVADVDYADLREHFGYALKRAQIASFEAFSRATRGAQITPPRFTALVILGGNPGISQSALGEALGTARSGAMMLADWLEQRGLAERRHRPDDARAWGLFLTGKGETLLRSLKRSVKKHDREFARRLDPKEQKDLLRLLGKLAG